MRIQDGTQNKRIKDGKDSEEMKFLIRRGGPIKPDTLLINLGRPEKFRAEPLNQKAS